MRTHTYVYKNKANIYKCIYTSILCTWMYFNIYMFADIRVQVRLQISVYIKGGPLACLF